MADKPLLFIDIDGVISLFSFALDARPPGRFVTIEGMPHFLSASAGENLLELAKCFEPVWCSGWEERAEEHLPHLLGLPGGWPHLSFDRSPGRANAHWKLGAIDAHAGHRPLAWVDDAFNQACWDWAAARPAATRLVATEPAVGLGGEQVQRLTRWARELACL
ncbi:MAG TPA: HAD domain-containing protein [Solirubrobacteraceae bacterium]|jgi:hypothetical protein|nr:HAD domain-containing protein [Solirubrobacteraceae bacterium]